MMQEDIFQRQGSFFGREHDRIYVARWTIEFIWRTRQRRFG